MHRSSNKTLRRSLSSDSQLKDSVTITKGSSVRKKSCHLNLIKTNHLLTAKLPPALQVDLSKLEMAALWRYALHFNLVSVFKSITICSYLCIVSCIHH